MKAQKIKEKLQNYNYKISENKNDITHEYQTIKNELEFNKLLGTNKDEETGEYEFYIIQLHDGNGEHNYQLKNKEIIDLVINDEIETNEFKIEREEIKPEENKALNDDFYNENPQSKVDVLTNKIVRYADINEITINDIDNSDNESVLINIEQWKDVKQLLDSIVREDIYAEYEHIEDDKYYNLDFIESETKTFKLQYNER